MVNIILSFRHKSVAKLLIESRADVNIQARDGYTAFDMASIIGGGHHCCMNSSMDIIDQVFRVCTAPEISGKFLQL